MLTVGEGVPVWGWGVWDVFSAQFCCEPKAALKNKVSQLKNQITNEPTHSLNK